MKRILLTNGDMALVDDEDFPLLSRFTWYTSQHGYPRTSVKGKFLFMHQLIMGTQPNTWVVSDHKNQNVLDNTKLNLRWASKQENAANSKPRGPFGFKGVRKPKGSKKYYAYISIRGKQVGLGWHETAEQAATAYNKKALEVFGEFTYLNKVEE